MRNTQEAVTLKIGSCNELPLAVSGGISPPFSQASIGRVSVKKFSTILHLQCSCLNVIVVREAKSFILIIESQMSLTCLFPV